MTRLLRHEGYPREDDGRVEKRTLLTLFHPTSPEVKMWTKRTWLNHQEKGSNEKRLQYCLDSNGNILNVRAMPSHTRESKLIYLCETVENQNSKRGRWTCRSYDEWRQPPPFEPPVARASKKARSLLSRLRHAEHPTTWASRATSAMDVACLSLSRRSKKRL